MTHGKNQGALPPLPWGSDSNAAVWKLVSLLEDPENRRKLFGKDPSEVSLLFTLNVCVTNRESHLTA